MFSKTLTNIADGRANQAFAKHHLITLTLSIIFLIIILSVLSCGKNPSAPGGGADSTVFY